jgi:hypothetical protein
MARAIRFALINMLWILFFKTFGTAAICYVAVTAGYFSWRVLARK